MTSSSTPPDLTQDQLRAALDQIFGEMSEDELEDVVREFEELEERLKVSGPENPDELHQWIKDEIGIDVPRTRVCPDHDAPFWFFADVFFDEKFPDWPEPDGTTRDYGDVGSALLMANRGGGKTFLVALLHYANSSFKPGCESVTFGATEYQSKRCYDHLRPWVMEVVNVGGEKKRRTKKGIEFSQKSETRWDPIKGGVPGSKVEVLSGTPEAVNGPHPNIAHADEVEQMREHTFDESRNMAIAGKTADGRIIKPKNILTSTRKSMHGRMQSLINEIRAAEAAGMIPPYKLYQYCIFETAAQVPNCRLAPDNEGKPDTELCNCHLIPKGMWSDGTDRTLDQVCDGRFYKSRGWQPKEQIDELFRQNVRVVWEAQQECRKPESEHNYIEWDEARDTCIEYDPNPEFGPIYEGIDWGAGNPNAVNLYQVLNQDLEVLGQDGDWKVLERGTWVVFDEIYEAEIGAGRLAQKVVSMERQWRIEHPKFQIARLPNGGRGRFADPAGRQQRLDFADAGLKTAWNATRDFEYHVERVQELHGDSHLVCAVDACPKFNAEIMVWRKNPQTGKQVDEFNHCMSNLRYAVVNVHRINQVIAGRSSNQRAHKKRRRKVQHSKRGPLGLAGQDRSQVLTEFGDKP